MISNINYTINSDAHFVDERRSFVVRMENSADADGRISFSNVVPVPDVPINKILLVAAVFFCCCDSRRAVNKISE